MIRLSKSILGELEISNLKDVLERGFLGMGIEVQYFENELSCYFSNRKVACVNSGTSALQLALQALGVGLGDEVLVPTLTYVASFQAITASGAVPIPCDINEVDGLIDIDDARNRITKNTKAIMPVHYASYAGDLDKVYSFANEFELRVVEDAAHAFGTTHKGKKIGSFGDVVCFSFDGIKNITSGEGGAIVSSDNKVINYVKDARLLGVERDTEKRFLNQRSWDFDVKIQGWRYHMSDIMAGIGRVQLSRFESEFKLRRCEIASFYRRSLQEAPLLKLFENYFDGVVPHIFPIRILEGRRDEIRESLDRLGIQTGIHYKPNHMLSYFSKNKNSFPVADRLYTELLTLPLHPGLSNDEIRYITSSLINLLERSS